MIYSARDIAKQLADRADAFCRWLLPNGALHSGNWCVGSVAGEAGQSLRIQITGTNAGAWADFAADEAGDLLGLIKAVRQTDIKNAIKIAKDWLGIRDPESTIPEKSYARPGSREARESAAVVSLSAVEKYLLETRGLDVLTLAQYRIEETKNREIVFKSYAPDGTLENIKCLAVQRDESGKKIIRQSKGCAPALFGWQAIDPEARELLITEGELDALTWFQMGFPAVSIPLGAKNHQWIDYEWERLLQFDVIYLNYDGDKEGQEGVARAAQRLGLHRCLIVTFPNRKDANDALTHGDSPCVFQERISAARPMEPEQIKTPLDFRDRVVQKFYPPDDIIPGFHPQLFHDKYIARPGEVTVWTGITSHGKSVLLSQLVLEAALVGFKSAIASMEMRGEQTLHRMICQSELRDHPRVEEIDAILEWLGGKVWIYDLLGNIAPDTLLNLMEYSFARHGVDMFVIDSLMKTTVVSDDYDAQRVFLNRLCSFSKDTNTHIHLVAHARKGRDESNAPGKLDVKGSADISNEADNIMSVWRNREKERDTKNDGVGLGDNIVSCEKQRETGEEFSVPLRYSKGIYRFNRLDEPDYFDLRITTRLELPLGEAGGNGHVDPELFDPEPAHEQPEPDPEPPTLPETSLPYADP